MSFKFVTVEEVKQATAELITARAKVPPETLASAVEKLREYRVDIAYIDDLVVTPQTLAMCEAVRKFIPEAKFGVTNDNKFIWVSELTVHRDVWMYTPDEPYARARIGYGDYSTESSSNGAYARDAHTNQNYMVFSRTIKNQKYSPGRYQFNMVMTKDFDKAVKNAKTHLRRFTSNDYAVANRARIQNEVTSQMYAVRSKLDDARRQALSKNVPEIIKELKHLVDINHTFLSSSFHERVLNLIASEEEKIIEDSRVVPGYFVFVGENRGEQIFDVIDVPNFRDDDYFKDEVLSKAPSQRYTAETLPEDIMGKLSVLSIMDVGSYVKSVGQRTHETMFWVEA